MMSKQLPIEDLSHIQKLELQNLLIRRDLYELQITRLDEQKQRIVKELIDLDGKFKSWKKQYENEVLSKYNLKFTDVDIDAETGKVIPHNIAEVSIPTEPHSKG